MVEMLLVLAIVVLLVAIAALLWRRRSRLAPQQSHEQGYGDGRQGIRRDGGTPSPSTARRAVMASTAFCSSSRT